MAVVMGPFAWFKCFCLYLLDVDDPIPLACSSYKTRMQNFPPFFPTDSPSFISS
ncbi:hypothetical protein MY11210_008717 [Beauveria gryllotalpidicola]